MTKRVQRKMNLQMKKRKKNRLYDIIGNTYIVCLSIGLVGKKGCYQIR